MKVTIEKGKLGALELDLRVRDRMLKKGILEPKALESFLAALPDLSAQVLTVDLAQPALAGSDDDDADSP